MSIGDLEYTSMKSRRGGSMASGRPGTTLGMAKTVFAAAALLLIVCGAMSAQLLHAAESQTCEAHDAISLPGSMWCDRRVALIAAEKDKSVKFAMDQLQQVLEQQGVLIEHLRTARRLARREKNGRALQRELEHALLETHTQEEQGAVNAVAAATVTAAETVATRDLATADVVTLSSSPKGASAAAVGADVELSATEAAAALAPPRIAVVIIAYNRPRYLQKALHSVLKHHPGGGAFPVYVSQDGENAAVAEEIKAAGVRRLVHPRATLDMKGAPAYLRKNPGYAYLSVHYGWALRTLFADEARYEGVILLEEDIEVADDFFDYFTATAPLLYQDRSLLCVSGFNDNGQERYASDASALHRSDFFPGLGWLLTRRLWNELGPKWPEAHGFWDDWLREPPQRQGRASIRPEVPRTSTFGELGTSHSQFYTQYLNKITLAGQTHPAWSTTDLRYLLRDAYETSFQQQLANAKPVSLGEALQQIGAKGPLEKGDMRVGYANAKQLEGMCKQLGIMRDLKAGVPRQAYHGVITLRVHGRRLMLAPDYKVEQDITHERKGDWLQPRLGRG